MSEIFRSFSGRVIDELRLTEYLAGSANSATFKVVVSGEAAAMKLFAVDSAQAEEKLARLRLAEKLSHPHLLRLIRTGRGEVEGTSFVYIVTEFAEENLAQVLPERALTPQETSEVLRATLDALAYLHAQGLVHGDLKPANIMASGDQLKLAVDGVQRIGEPLAREPGPHDAPESRQKLSKASDVWSLGMTMVEVLTQKLPPKPASEAAGPAVPETVPAPFREIAQHCLLRTPELRWGVDEIRAKLGGKAAAPVETLVPPVPTPMEAPRVPSAPARPRSRRPMVLLAIVAAIVLAIVFIPRMSEHTAAPPIPPQSESPATAPQPVPEQNANPEASATAPARETKSSDEMPATSEAGESASKTKHISDEPVEDSESEEATSPAAPGVVRQVMPQVTARARNSITGKVRVKVKVDVDASGNVEDTSFVSRGPSNYFARAAEDAARRWKFAASSTEARAWSLEFDFRRSGTQVRATPAR